MVTAVDRRALDRLRSLVEIETPTGDAEAIDAAHTLIDSWLATVAGTAGEIVESDGVRHLRWSGGESPSVLLLGHLDTVWPRGTAAARPFRVEGDRITGPGVFDMKAGIVVMAEALARVAHPERVAILVTSDEETGSITSRALIEQEARRCGTVLVLEPSLDGAVKTARRGGSIYRIEVHGRAAHAGLEPERGRNALTELAHQVLALPALADASLGTTVSPTVARAGTVTNAIPDHAELRIDVRAWSVAELERVHREMLALPTRTPDVELVLHGGINRPPMEPEASRELLAVARSVAAELGQPELCDVAVGGASDGNFTAAAGASTLDGLGPNGGGAHAVDEWVSFASMIERIALIAGAIDALDGAQSG
ncbi:glutamate carboxypeptidase [Agromyces mediolanus]|uniref:Glutamate carboxypeptidase n=1 Tax=Agromyces mediolanus TaxID=41986 RepID=A0A918CJI5_AGRME|nr:glutamate carboxypeptidase [Agromyces mediolanus]GLJ71930.1 glutamate carboxypeptidase [Agromyces mediolanus]